MSRRRKGRKDERRRCGRYVRAAEHAPSYLEHVLMEDGNRKVSPASTVLLHASIHEQSPCFT